MKGGLHDWVQIYQKYTEKRLVNLNLEELDEKSLITYNTDGIDRSLIERK